MVLSLILSTHHLSARELTPSNWALEVNYYFQFSAPLSLLTCFALRPDTVASQLNEDP